MNLKVIMADGLVILAKQYSYVVEAWELGEWKKVAVFEPTKNGYKEAQKFISNDKVYFEKRLIQLF